MSLTQELWSVLASATGIPFSEVAEIGRRIREDGLFVKETKSPRSPRATERDAANLIAACLSGASTRKAAGAVRALRQTAVSRDDAECLRRNAEAEGSLPEFAGKMAVLLKPEHAFVDALEAILWKLRQGVEHYGACFHDLVLSVERTRLEATVDFSFEIFPSVVDFSTPRKAVEQRMDYAQATHDCDGELRVEAGITVETLKAVARCLNRGVPA
jgi:hypothetical protein